MMLFGKEDLALSLSLTSSSKSVHTTDFPTSNNNRNNNSSGFFNIMNPNPNPTPTLQLNLMTSPSFTSSTYTPPVTDTCRSSYPNPKGIDVNRPTRIGDGDEDDVGVSSPYSTVSTLSGGKRSSGERDSDDGGACGGGGGSDDEEGGENSRKKLRLSKDQSATLEESFKEHSTLNPKQKQALAKRLGLRPRQVEVWFQNRRARTKLKQTEVDCEFLKGCCEKLTEENRRLQKEVLELRTLKMSPQFYMHMTPPTTLTMCPSCERVGDGSTSAHHPAHNVGSVSRPHHRPMPVNLWTGAAPVNVGVRPFEGLQPRS